MMNYTPPKLRDLANVAWSGLRIFVVGMLAIGNGLTTQAETASDLPQLLMEEFSDGAKRWQPTDPQAWEVVQDGDHHFYRLKQQSKYEPPFRSPFNIALLKEVVVGDFVLEARVRTTTEAYGHRDMCLIFGYQDPAHFYYVHFGEQADDHANQIFIVDGAARKKISATSTEGTPWNAEKWHHVKVVRDVASGSIEVFFDDLKKPVMTATNSKFLWGQVGLGSFDDTGDWDDVRLHGRSMKKSK